MDELFHQTPHRCTALIADNMNVFQILQDVVTKVPHESSLKVFQRTNDRNGAYLALVQHSLGSSKCDEINKEVQTYLLRRK